MRPPLFNPNLLMRRRARAIASLPKADYLLKRAVADLIDRLGDIMRPLGSGLLVGALGHDLPQQLAQQTRHTGIHWQYMDPLGHALAPMVLPFAYRPDDLAPIADSSMDVIVSPLLLHWVEDVPGILAQVRRILRPDGVFIANFLGGETLSALRHALMLAETNAHGGAAMRISPMIGADVATDLLKRAGFALPVADVDRVVVRFANVFGLLRDLKDMGETSAFAQAPTKPLTRRILADMASLYQNDADADGRVRAQFDLITMTGWAPDSGQQQPAKRGSAQVGLAQALADIAQKREND